jgi:heme a synthase
MMRANRVIAAKAGAGRVLGIPGRPLVRGWLYVIAALIFAMVLVGGATRLTDSGLSITEWQPILGVVPPLDEVDWQAAFEKYRQIPEYRLVNPGMSLVQFKFIYWWEWAHRFLGRMIGIAFLIPFLWLWLTGRLEPALVPRLWAIFALGGLQGVLGWYMVQSGLAGRVDVSQYRLAAHLGLAVVLYAAVLWVALGVGEARRAAPRRAASWRAALLAALVFVQIVIGAFLAGLDAGQGYNTWPLMAGRLVPDGLIAMSPWWSNLFENALTVQFEHRILAYAIALVAVVHLILMRRAAADTVGAAILCALMLAQIALGVWTLIARVPIELGLLHQAGALTVLSAALWHLHRTLQPVALPAPPGRG